MRSYHIYSEGASWNYNTHSGKGLGHFEPDDLLLVITRQLRTSLVTVKWQTRGIVFKR